MKERSALSRERERERERERGDYKITRPYLMTGQMVTKSATTGKAKRLPKLIITTSHQDPICNANDDGCTGGKVGRIRGRSVTSRKVVIAQYPYTARCT